MTQTSDSLETDPRLIIGALFQAAEAGWERLWPPGSGSLSVCITSNALPQ